MLGCLSVKIILLKITLKICEAVCLAFTKLQEPQEDDVVHQLTLKGLNFFNILLGSTPLIFPRETSYSMQHQPQLVNTRQHITSWVPDCLQNPMQILSHALWC